MTSTFVPSANQIWESSATSSNSLNVPNRHLGNSGYGGDLASSYNTIWEHHHHHHHHHNNSPAAASYRPEFFPGFACSPDFWPSSTPQVHNSMPSSTDSYRPSSNMLSHHPRINARSSSSSGSVHSTSQKKTRRRVATIAQRRAANIRERRRMFNLNEAFDKLRRKVPTFAYEKRLSRIETLRLAITYISFMNEILHGNVANDPPQPSIYQIPNQREYVPYVIL